MNKDWFPFFSMLFWCCTKLAGLALFVFGLNACGMWVASGFGELWRSLLAIAVPLVIGFLLLKSDLLYEIGTEGMRNQQPQPPR